jgi:hypothetical protein
VIAKHVEDIIRTKWMAEEEERLKGSLTPQIFR